MHLYSPVACQPHGELSGVTFHTERKLLGTDWQPRVRNRVIGVPFGIAANRLAELRERVSRGSTAPHQQLNALIQKLRPDVVHSLGIQHGGYITSDALQAIRKVQRPKWIVSTWGSDIYFFRHNEQELSKIRRVCREADAIFSDCPRDIEMAREMGFCGTVLGIVPGGGGYDLDNLRRASEAYMAPSKRKQILVKGYHDANGFGRALVALHAVEECTDILADYEIKVYSASADVKGVCEYLRMKKNIHLSVLPSLPHNELFAEFRKSRCAIALSRSDGLPNAFLEALLAGAFPIQSSSADVSGWGENGRNCLLVPYDSAKMVATAIRKVIQDDALVDQAADDLPELSRRLHFDIVRTQTIAGYRKLGSSFH